MVALRTPVLRASGLYRFFHVGDDETAALRGVDLTLRAGEFIVLQGPSGSGKSTLLNCLTGLDEPDGGVVEVLGERLTRRPEAERARLRAKHIGILLQSGNLFEHLTVRDNVRLQIELVGAKTAPQLDPMLARLGIETLGDTRPGRLSGGEAARAGLAVALGAAPAIVICDEPTAEVDAETEVRVVDQLSALCREGAAVLVATHSAALAARADRVIEIRDGKLLND